MQTKQIKGKETSQNNENKDSNNIQYTNTYNGKEVPPQCRIDLNPQQQKFEFGGITIDSQFDSGNIEIVEQNSSSKFHFDLYISPDCNKTKSENHYRTWFYYRVKGIPENKIATFTIKNLNYQGKLYKEGMMPVFKSSITNKWERVKGGPIDNSIENGERCIEITFKHQFKNEEETVYFAFTYPWSYEDGIKMNQEIIENYKNDDQIYVNSCLLGNSKEMRRIELLTITGQNNKQTQREKQIENLFPNKSELRPCLFTNKKYVLISARVHPGEIPGSHVLNGIVNFLLEKDNQQSKILRENFVFYFIPFLNPDGVYRGHYRTDTQGLNLNRFYINPNINDHPSIYAAKELFMQLVNTNRLHSYIDLHAHATRRGCFSYGNCTDFKSQVEVCLFPRLLSLNNPIFEYDACNFTEKNMYSKDKGDGLSKEGAGRVALYKQSKISLCYTIECNYNAGLITNNIQQNFGEDGQQEKYDMALKLGEYDKDVILNFINLEPHQTSEVFDILKFEGLGKSLCETILDYERLNPCSRLPNTKFKTLDNLKMHLANNLMKIMPHRLDPYVRKMNRCIQGDNRDVALKNLQLLLEKGIKNDPLDTTPYEEVKKPKVSANNNKNKQKPTFKKLEITKETTSDQFQNGIQSSSPQKKFQKKFQYQMKQNQSEEDDDEGTQNQQILGNLQLLQNKNYINHNYYSENNQNENQQNNQVEGKGLSNQAEEALLIEIRSQDNNSNLSQNEEIKSQNNLNQQQLSLSQMKQSKKMSLSQSQNNNIKFSQKDLNNNNNNSEQPQCSVQEKIILKNQIHQRQQTEYSVLTANLNSNAINYETQAQKLQFLQQFQLNQQQQILLLQQQQSRAPKQFKNRRDSTKQAAYSLDTCKDKETAATNYIVSNKNIDDENLQDKLKNSKRQNLLNNKNKLNAKITAINEKEISELMQFQLKQIQNEQQFIEQQSQNDKQNNKNLQYYPGNQKYKFKQQPNQKQILNISYQDISINQDPKIIKMYNKEYKQLYMPNNNKELLKFPLPMSSLVSSNNPSTLPQLNLKSYAEKSSYIESFGTESQTSRINETNKQGTDCQFFNNPNPVQPYVPISMNQNTNVPQRILIKRSRQKNTQQNDPIIIQAKPASVQIKKRSKSRLSKSRNSKKEEINNINATNSNNINLSKNQTQKLQPQQA